MEAKQYENFMERVKILTETMFELIKANNRLTEAINNSYASNTRSNPIFMDFPTCEKCLMYPCGCKHEKKENKV